VLHGTANDIVLLNGTVLFNALSLTGAGNEICFHTRYGSWYKIHNLWLFIWIHPKIAQPHMLGLVFATLDLYWARNTQCDWLYGNFTLYWFIFLTLSWIDVVSTQYNCNKWFRVSSSTINTSLCRSNAFSFSSGKDAIRVRRVVETMPASDC
jgi:hypothetical protein